MKNLSLFYYSNALLRQGINLACWIFKPSSRIRAGHLTSYPQETAIGPVQRDEGLFLLGLVRVIRPQIIVEFGFSRGRSAYNFLQAMPPETKLFSYDVSESARGIAEKYFKKWPSFHFLPKSQAEFLSSDIDEREIDLVFIDAAHELNINQATFESILPSLAQDAIIAVHDTGTWHRKNFLPQHATLAAASPQQWISEDEFAHQAEERMFVNWIAEEHPEFQVIHLHTTRCLRHGLTLLQRRKTLPVKRM